MVQVRSRAGPRLQPVRVFLNACHARTSLREGLHLLARNARTAFQGLSFTLSADVDASWYVAEVNSYEGTPTIAVVIPPSPLFFSLLPQSCIFSAQWYMLILCSLQSRGVLCPFCTTLMSRTGMLKARASFALATARTPHQAIRVSNHHTHTHHHHRT